MCNTHPNLQHRSVSRLNKMTLSYNKLPKHQHFAISDYEKMKAAASKGELSKVLHELDPSSKILTLEDVKIIAKRTWNRDIEILGYSIEPYSQEKLGFLSQHHSLSIQIRKKGSKHSESKNYFIKWLPLDNETLGRDMVEGGVFDRETAFYDVLVPLLRHGFQAGIWAPECYLITKDAMVLEDLRTKGFSIRKKLLNKEETMSSLAAIARMHAASILAEKRLGKQLNQICPRAFDLSFYYEKDGLWPKYFETALDLAITIARGLGLKTDRIPEATERLYELLEPSKEKQNVPTHSDLWSNNLMFDESSPPHCIIVDYQLMRYCPLAQDLLLFLHLVTNRAFRRRHQEEMIRFYYDELCRILRFHQPTIQVPSWSELMQGIEEQTLCAAILTMFFLPTVLLDGKVSAELLKKPEDFMTFRYRDKKIIVMPLMNEGGEYAERVKESVVEFVEIAERLEQVPRPR